MIKRLIYPNVCGFCGILIKDGTICVKCLNEIPYFGLKYMPFGQNSYFDELHCNYAYEGIVRNKMLDYKFGHKKYLCRTFSEGMLYRFSKVKPAFDIIIPVPIHRSRKLERGYNQSELIARIISKKLDIPCKKNVLVKKIRNRKQSKLGKEERVGNVRNVFEVKNGKVIEGKCILLVDDIYTTGATVNECSKVLKKAGAKRIIVYTVAKATINSHID